MYTQTYSVLFIGRHFPAAYFEQV